ncbi:MAG: hypothetical protein AAF288_01640 [Planctomycetota bacterium]
MAVPRHKARRRLRASEAVFFALIAVLVISAVGFLGLDAWAHAKDRKPYEVDTLSAWLQWKGHTTTAPEVLQHAFQGQVFVTTDGEGLLPSGEGIYIFDEQGRLIDYSLDSGQDPSFAQDYGHRDLARRQVGDVTVLVMPEEQ